MFRACRSVSGWRSGQQFFNAFAEFGAFFQVTHSVGDEGLHIAHFLTAVIAFAGHQHRVDGLLLRQLGNGVGQLDTAPGARLGALQFGPDICRQHVAAHRHQVGVQSLRFVRFFNKLDDTCHLPFRHHRLFGLDHGVFGEIARHAFRQHLAAAGLVKAGHHGGEVIAQRVRSTAVEDDIRQHHHKRVIPDDRAGAEDGVAQTQRLCLAHVHDGYARRANGLDFRQQLALHALLKQGFQLVGGIKVVFHRVLRGVRHQNNLFDPGGDDFVNNVLNHWLINDRQHLLWNCLCGRQHMHA